MNQFQENEDEIERRAIQLGDCIKNRIRLVNKHSGLTLLGINDTTNEFIGLL